MQLQPGVNGNYQDQPRYYNGFVQETYSYDDAGNLVASAIAETGYTDNGDGTISAHTLIDRAMGGGSFTFDLLGRMTHQHDLNEAGTVVYDNALTFDAKGRVSAQVSTQLQGSDSYVTSIANGYSDGTSGYAMGAVTASATTAYKVSGGGTTILPATATATAYAWYDGAVQSSVTYTPDTGTSGTTFTTGYAYTATGVLTGATIADGRPRTVAVSNDALGQALRRDEADGTAYDTTTHAGGDPRNFLGLELNPRAAAIAELVLWLGYLQWHLRGGGGISDPVLQSFGNIRVMDAVLAHDPERPNADRTATERPNPRRPEWPQADYIVGNPPFIGGKDLRARLPEGYAEALWKAHPHLNKIG
jgi:hypothetical protein